MIFKKIALCIGCCLFFLNLTRAQVKIGNQAKSDSSETRYRPKPFVPGSELYNTIVRMDSLYFDTYNTCNLAKMDSLTSDDFEFYHDKGGFSNSKKEYLESIKKNICGKVTRRLAKGSIEVYPIKDFGAVEIGYHSFKNNTEPGESEPSKFIVIWRFKDQKWQMTRVVSLH